MRQQPASDMQSPRSPRPRPALAMWIPAALALVALWVIFAASLAQPAVAAPPAQTTSPATSPTPDATPTPAGEVFLPLVTASYPAPLWFGVEALSVITSGLPLTRLQELGATWIRLGNAQFSWRRLQPNQGDPLAWDLMAPVEEELRALKAAGIAPRAVIVDSPRWATIIPSSCAAISPTYLVDFAAFVSQLVSRYQTTEFNVHDWELGNEPDVDPTLVVTDNGFGCWGEVADPFYGGRGYGEMLKVVGPAIRAIDPSARIWLGGLLLDRPLTTDEGKGRPELFLQGILEAGAAPWLDVVAYHAYPPYTDNRIDHDNDLNSSPWNDLGGNVLGKAAFLRGLMQSFGVNKPLVLNETGFMCPPSYPWCAPPDDSFADLQADHLVRTFIRGISGGVVGFSWYTIDAPGWCNSRLLEADYTARPAFSAYAFLAARLRNGVLLGPVDYGGDLEAYAFRADGLWHVLWSRDDITTTVVISTSRLAGAWDRSGAALATVPSDAGQVITVAFSPIYLSLNP